MIYKNTLSYNLFIQTYNICNKNNVKNIELFHILFIPPTLHALSFEVPDLEFLNCSLNQKIVSKADKSCFLTFFDLLYLSYTYIELLLQYSLL